MNRDGAIKILSILKAAYPNSYKGLTKEEANGTIMVWTTQFSNIPDYIVLMAINKLISVSQFPPAISEVKKTLHKMHYEARQMLYEHKLATEGIDIAGDGEKTLIGNPLDDKTYSLVKEIIKVTDEMSNNTNNEPTLSALIASSSNTYRLQDQNGA